MPLKDFIKKNFNFFHHLATGYSAIAINIIIFAFLTPYMLDTLGSEQYGIWQLVSNISMFFSMGSLGLSSAFYIEFARSKDDNEKSLKLINTVFFTYLMVGLISFIAYIFLLINFNRFFIINANYVMQAKFAFTFSYFAFLVIFIFGFLDLIIFLHNKITTRNIVEIFKICANGLGSIVLIALGFDIVAIAFLSLLTTILQIVFYYFKAIKLQTFHLSFLYFDFEYLKKLYKSGFYFFIYSVSALIIFNTDNIIISHFMGAEYVSLYAIIFRFVTISEKFIFVITSVKMPKVSQFIAQLKYSSVLDMYKKAWLVTLALSILVALVMSVFGLDILHLWLGDKYKFDIGLIWIFSILVVIHSLSNVTGWFLGSLNLIKNQSLISAVEVFSNLILSVILYQKYGLRGIALGTLISHIVVGSWYPGIYLLKQLKLKSAEIHS